MGCGAILDAKFCYGLSTLAWGATINYSVRFVEATNVIIKLAAPMEQTKDCLKSVCLVSAF